jgi:tRNA(fMet)-specific endonuclease VapC
VEIVETYDGVWYAPAPVLWESLRYSAQAQRHAGVASTAAALGWLEASSVTQAAAVEAATIEAELLDRGRQINALDVLFAGVVREAGRTIVTRDSDFERVEGLQVESY